jgi:hypothetical protein
MTEMAVNNGNAYCGIHSQQKMAAKTIQKKRLARYCERTSTAYRFSDEPFLEVECSTEVQGLQQSNHGDVVGVKRVCRVNQESAHCKDGGV